MYPESSGSSSGVERFIHLANSPADDDQSIAYFFLLPVLAARERITISTPYFIPSEPFVRALEQQARAGVDVRLLLPGTHIDDKLERWAAHRFYDRLLDAGVHIFEYQPTFIHAKAMVVDGKWSVIGSPNLNTRSRDLDEENAFGLLDETLARQLEASFAANLKQSVQINLKTWRGRNPFWRLLEFASRVVDKQS
jgi:cardiolipin synthase